MFYNLLTAPRTVSNTYAQMARAQSCANHVQHIEHLSRASVMQHIERLSRASAYHVQVSSDVTVLCVIHVATRACEFETVRCTMTRL